MFTNSFKEKFKKFTFQELNLDTPLMSNINTLAADVQKVMRGGEDGSVVLLPAGVIKTFFNLSETVDMYNACTDAEQFEKKCMEVVVHMQASMWLIELRESKTFAHLVPSDSVVMEYWAKARDAMFEVFNMGLTVVDMKNGRKSVIVKSAKDLKFLNKIKSVHPELCEMIECMNGA